MASKFSKNKDDDGTAKVTKKGALPPSSVQKEKGIVSKKCGGKVVRKKKGGKC